MNYPEFSVSQFVAVFNQTLEFAYPKIVIIGELANFRISKNAWVYFDLKDEVSLVSFFGSKFKLSGPLQDGMLVRVVGYPHLHDKYGFNITFEQIRPIGVGSIKTQQNLLKDKLDREGLFKADRKRLISYPPSKIGLITSYKSAAYEDFLKIIKVRWPLLTIDLIDCLVQGEQAESQIIQAISKFNELADYQAIVIIRGGGSPEDLAVFSSENLTRSVANSRIPTLVAIGHEIDLSLAELAADLRASTPSNAAELLVPNRENELQKLLVSSSIIDNIIKDKLKNEYQQLNLIKTSLAAILQTKLANLRNYLINSEKLLKALNPDNILSRGYAIVYAKGRALSLASSISIGQELDIKLINRELKVKVDKITIKNND